MGGIRVSGAAPPQATAGLPYTVYSLSDSAYVTLGLE